MSQVCRTANQEQGSVLLTLTMFRNVANMRQSISLRVNAKEFHEELGKRER